MTAIDFVDESYHYVVVGAGTAGCVIAARLSEDPGVRVLLLEAGSGVPLEAMAVPSAWFGLLGTTADWADVTTPQTVEHKQMSWSRGKGLGGSSAINGMLFCRGHRSSYDAWGLPGWGFDDLLPYFKRSETAKGRDPAIRGVDGPVIVGPSVDQHPVTSAGLGAAVEVGFRRAEDIAGGLEEGFGWVDLNVVDGRRQSAADSYLTTALDRGRDNLRVVTDALVRRVLVSEGRCTGVEYDVAGRVTEVRCVAGGTVVVTAGAIGTPQLLMLSGIGPAAHLQDHQIPLVVDSPAVGENLFDHPTSGVVYASSRAVPHSATERGGLQGMIRTEQSAVDGPDVQIMMVSQPIRDMSVLGPDMNAGYAVLASLMLPRSRGVLRLQNATPGAAPLIDPRYLTDPRDLAAMAKGLAVARRIGTAGALRPWRDGESWPGAQVDDDDLHHWVPRNLLSYYHYAGTCRMGTDEQAVVDTRLRVRGVSGLCVADASVLPGPISANTNATVYAVAERAVELLRTT